MKKNKTTKPPTGEQTREDVEKAKKAADALDKAKKPEGQDDDEDDEDEVEKSKIDLDDLEKGLKELEATGKNRRTRKEELLEKARTGLSAEERRELDAELDGRTLQKALENEQELAKAMDASPALDVLGTRVSEAVDRLASNLQKSESDRSTFEKALATSIVGLGRVVAKLTEKVESLEGDLEKALDAPAREPRAVSHQPIEREVPGAGGAGAKPQQIDSRKLASTLEAMHRDSVRKGEGGTSRSGISIKTELTKALTGLDLDPRILRDAADWKKANTAT